MQKVTFEYSALYYLNCWLTRDRDLCEGLGSDDVEAKRKTLIKAAVSYRVMRSLRVRREHELKLPRLQRAIEIVTSPDRAQFVGANLIPAIMEVRHNLCAAYERKDLLSMTIKFLWLRFKHPIIIYDRNARQALGTSAGNLQAYYKAWTDRYQKDQAAVRSACTSLATLTRYCVDPAATPKYVAALAAKRWFHERVFDIYLWHLGG